MAKIRIDSQNKAKYSNGTYPEVTSITWCLKELGKFFNIFSSNSFSQNKAKYSNGTYPEVTSITWCLKELDENILKNFPNLTKLSCSHDQITDLGPLQICCSGLTGLFCWDIKITNLSPLQYCTGLTELYCSYNQITDLSPLQYCTRLTELYCSNNQITDLSPLQYCTGLTKLYCHYNQITDLSPLRYCTGLSVLDCNSNQITDLSPLQFLRTGLTKLYCWDNKITDLNPLQYCTGLTELHCSVNEIIDLNLLRYCTGLTKLDCSDNQITDLSPLQYCTRLTKLDCSNNQITSLEPLVYLRRLTYLDKNNNPLNPPSIQVTRFLERIEANRRNNTTNNSIYNDTQNVHDVKVQQSVMDSVRNLMRDGLYNKIILDLNSVLTSELKANTKSRLLEYFEETDYHVILLITYKELFTYVWNRIINNPNRLELLKILDDNIQDSEYKCFTGRFNRTLSTLVGFYDDIEINISDSSRISAIILQVKASIIPYDPDKHRELAQTALRAAGYDSETIDIWTLAIE